MPWKWPTCTACSPRRRATEASRAAMRIHYNYRWLEGPENPCSRGFPALLIHARAVPVSGGGSQSGPPGFLQAKIQKYADSALTPGKPVGIIRKTGLRTVFMRVFGPYFVAPWFIGPVRPGIKLYRYMVQSGRANGDPQLPWSNRGRAGGSCAFLPGCEWFLMEVSLWFGNWVQKAAMGSSAFLPGARWPGL